MSTTLQRIGRAPVLVAALVPLFILTVYTSANTPLGFVPAFLPATIAVAWICDALTVFLLLAQFHAGEPWRLLALASAYLWSATVLPIYGLVFPGLFSATGLLGATPSSAVWLWATWHTGFPLLIGLALAPWPTRRQFPAAVLSRFRMVAAGSCALAVLGGVAALSWLVTAQAAHIPVIITGGDYSALTERFGTVIIGVNLLAVAVSAAGLFTRSGGGLEAWAFVAVCASCGDTLLTLFTSSRFTVGWYGARVLSLTAALVVLANLLRRINLRYERVRRSADELAQRNEELQAAHIEELREQNIELERASGAKDNFLASMSHELRTPLNVILGFTGTVLMRLPGPLNAEQEHQLRLVQNSGQHLLSIINDLLDLAKIKSGRVEIALEAVDCRRVADEVVQSLQPLADGKGLALTIEATDDTLMVATVDRRALGQILINLVNNAIKFTNTGEVRVCLIPPAAETAEPLRIAVRDTGPGIPEADLTRIFRAFERSATAKASSEGTGLGLHISQKLAELLCATLTVSSTLGEGSTFTISLTGPAEASRRVTASSNAEHEHELLENRGQGPDRASR
jgi:signal transduction histidine kinase